MPSLFCVQFGLSLTLLGLSLSATHIELSGLSKIQTIDNVHAAHCPSCVSPPIQTYQLSRQDARAIDLATPPLTLPPALVSGEKSNFQFILRLLNTNVDGKQKIMYALTKIKGVGRRYSNLVCKKADVDLNKRYALYSTTASSLSILTTWLSELVRSHPKNSSVLSPSSKTPLNTKSPPGSSTDNAILWMARTRKFWPTEWTASYVRIWNA